MSVQTKNIMKRAVMAFAGGLVGLVVMSATPASAFERPDPCNYDHDHRSHNANYYDYYDKDRYYRAGPYRASGFSITIGSRDYDRRRGDYRGRDYNRRSDYRRKDYRRSDYDRRGNRRGSKVIKRDVFNTRYNARIVLTEEIVYGRRGNRLICTVKARGREAGYVPYRRLKRVAHRNCSGRSRINIIA